MLTQLGDINIHRAGIEIIVINPDGLQGKVALKNLVGMTAKQSQQFIFLRSQFRLLITNNQQLLLGVEGKLTNAVNG